jgi:cell division protein FtsQ
MSIDLGELRARVKAIDWVDRVSAGRQWPDTLIVRVTEHQAAARWGEEGLLNVRGELFTEHSEHAFPELPSLAGPSGSEQEVAKRYLAVRGRLAEADLKLERLSMDQRGAWSLVLGGGQEIRLGRRDIDERLLRFFDVVAPALAGELPRVSYVDLRYTNGFAVGWRASDGGTLAAAGAADRG